MYRNAAGGGAAGLLAATGYAGPTTILVAVGLAAALVGVLLLWRSMKLRSQPAGIVRHGRTGD